VGEGLEVYQVMQQFNQSRRGGGNDERWRGQEDWIGDGKASWELQTLLMEMVERG